MKTLADTSSENATNMLEPGLSIETIAPPNCIRLTASFGQLLLEGYILRAGGKNGRHALAHLAGMIARHGPAAIMQAEGDFVALIETETDTYAFKSFTSQYQLYYREADCKIANRLSCFYDPENTA